MSLDLGFALTAGVLLWIGTAGAVAIGYRRQLRSVWREPVWRCPVLVLESDDWGVGPEHDSDTLRALAGLLKAHRDVEGRPARMTLGVILACAEGDGAMQAGAYRRITLEDRRFSAVLTAMWEGVSAGVFWPQLHGMEHFRPESVRAAAELDQTVRTWLSKPCASASDLPSHLQSGWTEASVLPSRPLPREEVESTVREECALFRRLFGPPAVAVPTTFVWTKEVEAAWAEAGVEIIVTPGRRCTRREADGRPGGVDLEMYSGERSAFGPLYVVRDVYFEPALGHRAERLVQGLQARRRLGRACLVEMHRFNFVGEPARIRTSMEELDRALRAALEAVPDLRFLATAEVGHILANRDSAWIDVSFRSRVAAWLGRLDELPRFPRLSRLTGLVVPLWLLRRWATG